MEAAVGAGAEVAPIDGADTPLTGSLLLSTGGAHLRAERGNGCASRAVLSDDLVHLAAATRFTRRGEISLGLLAEPADHRQARLTCALTRSDPGSPSQMAAPRSAIAREGWPSLR